MRRRVIVPFLWALLVPLVARANVISLQGSGDLLPETAGQQIVLLIAGSDFYSESTLRTSINNGIGPAPFVTHVFGDSSGSISPASLYAGSIWAGGLAGIGADPNATYPFSSGLELLAGFATFESTSQNTTGIYAVLTISTVGVPVGNYTLSLAGTEMFRFNLDTFDNDPVPLELPNIVLRVPEPSTYALAVLGIALLAALRPRRFALGEMNSRSLPLCITCPLAAEIATDRV